MIIKKVFVNTIWIYVLQTSTAIVPLLTLPYATRTIGLQGIAFFGIAVAVGSVASVICEYSFDLTGVKAAASARGSSTTRNRVIVERLYAQWTIFAALLGVGLLVSCLSHFAWDIDVWLIVFAAAMVALSNILFSFWVSQSLGTEKEYSIYFAIGRILSLPLVFLSLAAWPNGFYYVLTIYLPIIIAITVLLYRSAGRKIAFIPYEIRRIRSVFITSLDVFFSRLLVSLYQNGGLLVLGFTASTEAVGLFAVADRVRKASLFVLTPISRAIYPVACTLADTAGSETKPPLRLFYIVYASCGAAITITLYTFASAVATLFSSENADGLSTLIQVFAFFPAISSASILFGQNFLLARGHVRPYTISIAIAFLLYACAVVPLSYVWNAQGAAISFLFAEFSLALAFLYFFLRVTNK